MSTNVIEFPRLCPESEAPPEAVAMVRDAWELLQRADELMEAAARLCDAAGIPRHRNGAPMVGPSRPRDPYAPRGGAA